MNDQHDHGPQSFDERARDWDDDVKVARAETVASAIRGAVTVDATTRLLEYGAGTGLAAQALAAGPLGATTLADPSEGMRAVMHTKIADGRLPSDAVVADFDLGDPIVASEFAASFDLAVTVLVLHHIPHPEPVLAGFAEVLAPGGALCIADLDREDGSFHEGGSHDVHDGFDRDELAGLLRAAGFDSIEFSTVGAVEKHGRDYPMFLAVARR